MDKGELVQWTVVAVIVLVALLWVTVRILKLGKGKSPGADCSCCRDADSCKAKELKKLIPKDKSTKIIKDKCHDSELS